MQWISVLGLQFDNRFRNLLDLLLIRERGRSGFLDESGVNGSLRVIDGVDSRLDGNMLLNVGIDVDLLRSDETTSFDLDVNSDVVGFIEEFHEIGNEMATVLSVDGDNRTNHTLLPRFLMLLVLEGRLEDGPAASFLRKTNGTGEGETHQITSLGQANCSKVSTFIERRVADGQNASLSVGGVEMIEQFRALLNQGS